MTKTTCHACGAECKVIKRDEVLISSIDKLEALPHPDMAKLREAAKHFQLLLDKKIKTEYAVGEYILWQAVKQILGET